MQLNLTLSPFHVEQLREVIDAMPLRTHGGLVLAILPQLPLEAGPLDPTPWCAYGIQPARPATVARSPTTSSKGD